MAKHDHTPIQFSSDTAISVIKIIESIGQSIDMEISSIGKIGVIYQNS